ncbi:MAG: hypothetical protein NXI32_11490 [bacterium]|nr:hypothetical protein [bacterium]
MQELGGGDLDRLADLIAERLSERLNLPAHNQPKLVDAYGLADAIGLSVPSIHRAVAAGTIPSIRAGGRRLYCVPEVIEAMRAAGPNLTRPDTTRAQRA